MKNPAEVNAIIQELERLYPDALCSLQYKKDYELLFAVRLSAQCTDARVNQVTPALFARFPTLESFARASEEEVGEYVHSCGFGAPRPTTWWPPRRCFCATLGARCRILWKIFCACPV